MSETPKMQWRLVPAEPTPEMLEACTTTSTATPASRALRAEVMRMAAEDYRHMLASAPAAECPLRFPTMLRKMWPGITVQDWIDAEWDKLAAAGFPLTTTVPVEPEVWINTEDGNIEHSHKPWMGPEWQPLVCVAPKPVAVVPDGEAWADPEQMLNALGFYRREPGTRVVADEELELLTTAVHQNDGPAALEVLARIAPEAAGCGCPLGQAHVDELVTKGSLTQGDEALVLGMLDGSVSVADELHKMGKQLREGE